jgi:tyrosine-protein kinase Etk/Wzc
MQDPVEIRLKQIVSLFKKRIKSFIFVPIFGFICFTVISYLIKETFVSTAIVHIQGSSPSLPNIPKLGDMSSFGDIMNAGTSNYDPLFADIFKSREIQEQLVQKFKLDSVYGIKHLEKTLIALSKKLSIDEEKSRQLLRISFESNDPEEARNILNSAIQYTQKRYDEIEKNRTLIKTSTLKLQLEAINDSIQKTSDSLISFSSKNRILEIDLQIESFLKSYDMLISEKTLLDIQQKSVELSGIQDQITQKRNQSLQKALLGEINKQRTGRHHDFSIHPDSIMQKKIQFEVLATRLKLLNSMSQFMTSEITRLSANLQAISPIATVIQSPYVPDYKTKPKRAFWALGGMFFSSLIWISLILFKTYGKEWN